jgi:Zn-dependent M28 family amino/carboxypeptidase
MKLIPYLGSGVVNVLEIFRTLVSSGQTFNRTIQFMTYSAEEGNDRLLPNMAITLHTSISISHEY